MTRQILKASAMVLFLVGLALVSAVTSASAQTSSRIVSADVPFSFIVGEQHLPAGKYIVAATTNTGDTLLVKSRDARASAMRLSNSLEGRRGEASVKLVFRRYGQRYFLGEVWGGDSIGRQLIKSKQERSIERELASMSSKNDLAMNTYERVEVVAIAR